MKISVLLFVGFALAVVEAQAPPVQPVATLSCAEIETFLKTARIGRQRSIPVGVTIPSRAPLSDGKLQHDAAIQTVDISRTSHPTATGTELNFRDAWQFNVAGYELAKMLELNMVPPYVERTVSGVPASVSWWINGAMMERDRLQKKIAPPDLMMWNAQILASRLFRELIADTDFNPTNLLITEDWRVWMIDFSRAFRQTKKLQEPERLTAVDRKLLARVKELTEDSLRKRLNRWLSRSQIQMILARRDLIVAAAQDQIAARGEASVLYDLPRSSEPCGTGLH